MAEVDIVEIHVTCPTLEDARQLSHALLDARLVACVNIGAEVDSRYWWKGEKERHDEVPVAIKTRADRFDDVAAAIREHHPYETPAIFGHSVPFVDESTRAWIAETCAPGA
ncbi:divalent-cation tolerance protein CutA [Consotaella aegiceratis]|uniref:divalent-cation tolerance protein CutA n=1 Tax=Consotaella aegiceratis TaxID=3097961 RepID=UPI002F3FA831